LRRIDTLIVPPYTFSEDSELLREFLSSLSETGSFLEIGAGGGGILCKVLADGRFGLVVGTDVMDLSKIRQQISRKAELVQADRASCFRQNSFDLVGFNPPYVPSVKVEDVTTDGGSGGVEVPIQFLCSALTVLKPKGKIAMVLSSEDNLLEMESFCEKEDLVFTRSAEKKLFFETLYVYLITRRI
jgi:release factor glutamine methyltransferase